MAAGSPPMSSVHSKVNPARWDGDTAPRNSGGRSSHRLRLIPLPFQAEEVMDFVARGGVGKCPHTSH